MSVVTRRRLITKTMAAFAAMVGIPGVRPASAAAQRTPVTHRIEIRDFAFEPDRLEVRPGDTICWINRDIVPHTASAFDDEWDTGQIMKDAGATLRVTAEMSPRYYCRFHPAMKAQLTVAPQ